MKAERTFEELRVKEREFRKNLILDMTLNLFETKTMTKTSMHDIAKALGTSPATLYSYFPSREELFLEAFIRDLSSIDQIMKTSIEEGNTGDHGQSAMDALADAMVEHLMKSEATFQMVSLLITKGSMPDSLLDKFNALRHHLNERVTHVLQNSGIQTSGTITSRAFFASVLGVIMLFRNYPEKDMPQPEESIKAIVRYIVHVLKAGIPLVEENANAG
jgi:AcrR family transcriptional regulator